MGGAGAGAGSGKWAGVGGLLAVGGWLGLGLISGLIWVLPLVLAKGCFATVWEVGELRARGAASAHAALPRGHVRLLPGPHAAGESVAL